MANKIAQFSPSPNDLKRMFEAGVCNIQNGPSAKALHYGAPIAPRGTAVDVEKRGLSDAARALAQLWKVSAHPAR